jgi:SAM-dependent methyltransferase
MHQTAMQYGKQFFEKYGPFGTVAEVGSMVVAGGSLREVATEGCLYVGIDCADGTGVDVVAVDPYDLPIHDSRYDAVVSSSTFEHADFFWLTFLEMVRICKPGGYIYVNSPSNGYVHRHPVDCWRFYPDAGQALAKWAERNGQTVELVETFMGEPDADVAHWIDWVAVWRKG